MAENWKPTGLYKLVPYGPLRRALAKSPGVYVPVTGPTDELVERAAKALYDAKNQILSAQTVTDRMERERIRARIVLAAAFQATKETHDG